MEYLEHLALKKKYTKVTLPASKTAIEFYKKRGYALINKKEEQASSFCMEKLIE